MSSSNPRKRQRTSPTLSSFDLLSASPFAPLPSFLASHLLPDLSLIVCDYLQDQWEGWRPAPFMPTRLTTICCRTTMQMNHRRYHHYPDRPYQRTRNHYRCWIKMVDDKLVVDGKWCIELDPNDIQAARDYANGNITEEMKAILQEDGKNQDLIQFVQHVVFRYAHDTSPSTIPSTTPSILMTSTSSSSVTMTSTHPGSNSVSVPYPEPIPMPLPLTPSHVCSVFLALHDLLHPPPHTTWLIRYRANGVMEWMSSHTWIQIRTLLCEQREPKVVVSLQIQ